MFYKLIHYFKKYQIYFEFFQNIIFYCFSKHFNELEKKVILTMIT